MNYWEEVFAEQLVPDKEARPDFRNSVIWDFQAKCEGEAYTNLKWQLLYALPSGMGISCCRPDYVETHLEDMNCRYIATVSGGTTDIRCRELGYAELGRDADMVVYRRY